MMEFVASISLTGWMLVGILALFLWNLPRMLRGLFGGDMIDDTTGKPPDRPRSDGRFDAEDL